MMDKQRIAPAIWQLCDDIYNQKIRLVDGKKQMYDNYQLNETSFHFYYYAYKGMLDGVLCTRSIQPEIRDYMLSRIQWKYGNERLRIALKAYMEHITYYEGKTKSNLHKERNLYAKYVESLKSQVAQNPEDELLSLIKDSKREEIIAELKSIKVTDPEQITIHSHVYSRDSKTIAQLKILRSFTCQICGTQIPKADGTYYIEAAHITPKAMKGPELPSNILILCPNHHKEFDFGKLLILERNEKYIRFNLNGKEYTISLELK